jgi:hypothetical protein
MGVALARLAKHEIEAQQQQLLLQTTTVTHQQTNRNSTKQDVQMTETVATAALVPTTTSSTYDTSTKNLRTLLLPTYSISLPLTSSVCIAVTPLIVLLFVLADVLVTVTTFWNSNAGRVLQVLPQSMAYGLMHTTASDATDGTVLFAVTGHWAAVSLLSVDRYYLHKSDSIKQSEEISSFLARRARMLASFIAGVMCSVLFLDRILPILLLLATPSSNSCSLCFPRHTITGLLYTALFLWYGHQ